MKEQFLEHLFYKSASRKLIAFITATVLLCTGTITSDSWENVAYAFIGTEGLIAAISAFKGTTKTKNGKEVEQEDVADKS